MVKNEKIIIKKFFSIDQPIGRFLVCSLKPSELLKISNPKPRKYDESLDKYVGIQRQLDKAKIKELKEYIKTEDASFPNSIIANLDTSFLKSYTPEEIIIETSNDDESALFIIDGQHRAEGFRNENKEDFELIVTIFLGLGLEEQGYLFSTINNKQKRLSGSLVQDLNDLFVVQTPEKIVHVITKLFNEEKESPWKNKIKILGKDIEKNGNKIVGIMSQYSFAKEILKLIIGGSKDYFEIRDILKKEGNDRKSLLEKFSQYQNKYVLWSYYVNNREDFIYQSLLSYFNAIKDSLDGWGDDNYITTKTTGYIAFMKFYEHLIKNIDDENKMLDHNFFKKIFIKIKPELKELKSEYYESGVKGQKKLYEDILKYYNKNKAILK